MSKVYCPCRFLGGTRTYTDVVNLDMPVAGALTIVSAIGGAATLEAQPASNQIQVNCTCRI